MRLCLLLSGFLFFSFITKAQDTVYARKTIKYLTSEKCFGRGYIKNGLGNAAKYIVGELKKEGVTPLFDKSYYQDFHFDVNTFPGKMSVKIDGKLLTPGVDYIVTPECKGASGAYILERKDSVTFVSQSQSTPLAVSLKRKLTFSVAQETAAYCGIQLLNHNNYNDIKTAEINIQNKLVKDFLSRNICGYFPGTVNNDSVIIFSAHYDHLGGMGKNTFFPGANDNASGVSVLLNLVKYYKAHPPKYKTLFIFFSGEEAGLIGSHYFVTQKTIDLKKIKFLINLDLLGTGDTGIMVVNGAVYEKEYALLNKINAGQNLVKEIKKRGKASNSDHYWFSQEGVPCFFIYTTGGTTSYHDVFDVAEKLPLTDYMDVFKLVIAFAEQL